MTEPIADPDDAPPPRQPRARWGTELALVPVDAAPPAPPEGAVLRPPAPVPADRGWLPAKLLAEIRLAVRMYFDPRYRVSRTVQVMFPVILGLFALNYIVFAVWFAVPVVSPVLERLACVLLGIYLYRTLTRELARYREVLDYLARYGR